jgi:hypothetical protein
MSSLLSVLSATQDINYRGLTRAASTTFPRLCARHMLVFSSYVVPFVLFSFSDRTDTDICFKF